MVENMKLQICLPLHIVCLILGWFFVSGCSSDSTHNDIQPNPPRVIAVNPKPGAQRSTPAELRTATQEFSVSFSQPIIPNSGRIVFGGTPYQLQEIEATDTITWNQCFRSFAIVAPDDNIGSMVIRDFQNVNGDVQLNPYEGWYWIPRFDITGPQVLDYHPIGQDVDPKTTHGVRVVFDRPMQDGQWEEKSSCEISPPIKIDAPRIDNDDLRTCTGIVTWEFSNTQKLNYATKYSVTIEAIDRMGNLEIVDFSFTTRAPSEGGQ